ncbi:LuxR C-terminal-related transcriptional regulator [Kitasatospora sp. NPDC056531]|uniref:helix-turn-helix transcriptional regulator n=1 Tax=Kitasatospora sp. NPDC056531 TaxID=3345856 RepID=UPI003680DB0F
MRLVERERELAELVALLCQGAHGGGAALIGGGIGCGKTEFLAEVKRLALGAGFEVLSGVGSWAERDAQGGVLNQLLRSAGRPAVAEITMDALYQLCDELVRASANGPMLICVDDVQFADRVSLHGILKLLQRLRDLRAVLVFVDCALSRPAHPELHAELIRQPNYRRVTLGRLSAAGVTALLAQEFGAASAAVLGAACHAVSGGNPLLVRALIQDHRRACAASPGAVGEPATGELSVGEVYGDAVLGSLYRGRPVLLRTAQALAVLDGCQGARDLVARLIGEEPDTAARAVDTLDTAGLLDGGRLRHPVARQAVLDSLRATDRADLHVRAAEQLYQDGAQATRVSHHLLAAGPAATLPTADRGGRLPWAVSVMREAAEQHLAGNRAADARRCLEAALRLSDDDRTRVGLRALLASTVWMLNPSISTPHLGELAIALREGLLPDRSALILAKYLLWHGRFDEAAEAIARIGTRPERPDPGDAAEIRATRELLSATYPGLVAPDREDGEDADPRIRAAGALSRVLAEGPDATAVAQAEAAMRALRLGKSTQEWLMCAVAALAFADRLEAAGNWCDHWLEESRARHVPLWVAEFASLRASIALRQGAPVRARQLAEAALAQVPAASWGVCIGGPLANLVQAATDTGDLAAAAEYLQVAVPDGMFCSRFGLYFLHARARYHLATGRAYAALDDLTTCGELVRAWGFDQPTLLPWRSEAARAHLALGDLPQARELALEELELAGERPVRARAVALRAVAATSDRTERPRLLAKAVEILQSCGDRLQLAGALADLGRAHAETGHPAQARPVLGEALRLAEEAGAAPLVRELRAAGAAVVGTVAADRAARWARLSEAERRVAVLAARGHTNREIAERLTVTVSTVEQHITRIFRKLGVRTRQELPTARVLEATVK